MAPFRRSDYGGVSLCVVISVRQSARGSIISYWLDILDYSQE